MNLIQNSQTNWKYLSIIIVLAISVIGIWYYEYSWWLIKPPEITLESETADWQTYRNLEYGFEVKYPNNWKYLSCMDGMQFELYSPNNPVGDCDEPRFNSDFSIVGPGFPPGNIDNAKRVEKIILSGIEAKKYVDVPVGQVGELLEDGIVISKDNKTFYIALESIKEYPGILNQILSTFKFIE